MNVKDLIEALLDFEMDKEVIIITQTNNDVIENPIDDINMSSFSGDAELYIILTDEVMIDKDELERLQDLE